MEKLIASTCPGVGAAGDTVTLAVGTITTTANYAGAPPANDGFNAFIARTTDRRADCHLWHHRSRTGRRRPPFGRCGSDGRRYGLLRERRAV